MKRLDVAAAISDPLRNEDAGTGLAVEIRKVRCGSLNRECRQARQSGETNLALQLVAPTIAEHIGEVAREFHEKVGVQVRFRMLILDR